MRRAIPVVSDEKRGQTIRYPDSIQVKDGCSYVRFCPLNIMSLRQQWLKAGNFLISPILIDCKVGFCRYMNIADICETFILRLISSQFQRGFAR